MAMSLASFDHLVTWSIAALASFIWLAIR